MKYRISASCLTVAVLLAGCGGSTAPAQPKHHTDAYQAMMADCVLNQGQSQAWCSKEVPKLAKQEGIAIWR